MWWRCSVVPATTLLLAFCWCCSPKIAQGSRAWGGGWTSRSRPSFIIATPHGASSIHHSSLQPVPWSQAGQRRRLQPFMGLENQSGGSNSVTGLNAMASSSSSMTLTASPTVVGRGEVVLSPPEATWIATSSGSGGGGRQSDDDGGNEGGGGDQGDSGKGDDGKQVAGPLPMDWLAGLTLLWEQYVEVLERHPLRTKSITAALIAVIGDIFAQIFEELLGLRDSDPTHITDLVRSMAVFLEGLLVTGPGLHFLYGALEKWIPSQISLWNSVVHVAADEFLFDPLFVLGFFLICGVLEGKDVHQDIVPQIKDEYWAALKGGWIVSLLFLPLEFATFRCLPVQFRVLVVNLTDVAWTAVVSYFTHLQRNRLDRRRDGGGVPALAVAH